MKKTQITEADCWFVVGAHQAGATEQMCSDLSGLSKSATHTIIKNFRKQGSPHAAHLSVATMIKANTTLSHAPSKRKADELKGNQLPPRPRKRGRPRKPEVDETIFSASFIRHVLLPRRRTSSPILTNPCSPLGQSQEASSKQPPCEEEDALPPTPQSLNTMNDEEEDEGYKKETSDMDDVDWTVEDDRTLIMHMLEHGHSIKWKEVEIKFKDRHGAKMCNERWLLLKKQMLKDIPRFMK
ncbi:uncharacterized protein BYT42DRAFT_526687 [Radiomyces spectabilis]|uniref:uncharacterized protein n=1 Tax=Radiomyces spectabilis TaxID=64574 RepID=UPI00222054E8|nr:uncharacterized protein BYT42DRAFT_526687 [Radiomyces spectabilis]KAI8391270.1 hypothetical protein BYT42DRAFT_526687 [Radiomyces spectabilis]